MNKNLQKLYEWAFSNDDIESVDITIYPKDKWANVESWTMVKGVDSIELKKK